MWITQHWLLAGLAIWAAVSLPCGFWLSRAFAAKQPAATSQSNPEATKIATPKPRARTAGD